MEWKSGLILRIRSYKFEDDQSTRDKYCIVLHTSGDKAYLIHSLTTSQNKFNFPELNYGCSVHYTTPYFFIPQNTPIGNENFFFEKNTFIFFNNNIRKELKAKFESAAETLFGVTALGVLSNEELVRIIKCALKSKFLTEDVEKELTDFKMLLSRDPN